MSLTTATCHRPSKSHLFDYYLFIEWDSIVLQGHFSFGSGGSRGRCCYPEAGILGSGWSSCLLGCYCCSQGQWAEPSWLLIGAILRQSCSSTGSWVSDDDLGGPKRHSRRLPSPCLSSTVAKLETCHGSEACCSTPHSPPSADLWWTTGGAASVDFEYCLHFVAAATEMEARARVGWKSPRNVDFATSEDGESLPLLVTFPWVSIGMFDPIASRFQR